MEEVKNKLKKKQDSSDQTSLEAATKKIDPAMPTAMTVQKVETNAMFINLQCT